VNTERCDIDPGIQRVTIDDMAFPLGVYPIEDVDPRQGYTLDFEAADGDSGDWEEWPDRYVFDIVISVERLPALIQSLLGLMPPRVYPILDVLGHDAYREIDPYISYDLLGLDQLLDALIRYRPFFIEDGLTGFGAMSESPFCYVFIDEHKIITARVEPGMKPRVERILKAFDLKERDDPAGPDSVAHEHRGVLLTPAEDASYLSIDDILERLRDEWRLVLNVDPESNTDDRGRELGITPWRCIVRTEDGSDHVRYVDVFLTAGCLREAEDLAIDAVIEAAGERAPAGPMARADSEPVVMAADRSTPDGFIRELSQRGVRVRKQDLGVAQVWSQSTIGDDPG
jgi:hypothetical protein